MSSKISGERATLLPNQKQVSLFQDGMIRLHPSLFTGIDKNNPIIRKGFSYLKNFIRQQFFNYETIYGVCWPCSKIVLIALA